MGVNGLLVYNSMPMCRKESSGTGEKPLQSRTKLTMNGDNPEARTEQSYVHGIIIVYDIVELEEFTMELYLRSSSNSQRFRIREVLLS